MRILQIHYETTLEETHFISKLDPMPHNRLN